MEKNQKRPLGKHSFGRTSSPFSPFLALIGRRCTGSTSPCYTCSRLETERPPKILSSTNVEEIQTNVASRQSVSQRPAKENGRREGEGRWTDAHTSHNRRHDDDANKSLEMATMEDIAIRRMNNLVLLHLVLERDRNEEREF